MASKINIDLDKLLESGAHFGHQTKRWNPRMHEYVYGVRDGVHIFDLLKTQEALEEALEMIAKARAASQLILLVGTKRQAKDKLREVAIATNVPFVDERWLGGTLTNFAQIRASVKSLQEMKRKMAEGEYKSFTKKERLLIERDIEKLERKVGGLVAMDKKPDLMVIIDTHRERGAVEEARKMKVTTVGLVDTNADPADVDYPVPMNDDASAALDYVLDLFAEALGATPKKAPAKTTKKVAKKVAKKAVKATPKVKKEKKEKTKK